MARQGQSMPTLATEPLMNMANALLMRHLAMKVLGWHWWMPTRPHYSLSGLRGSSCLTHWCEGHLVPDACTSH